MYFQLLASTICFYGIGMKEPVLFVFVYGLSFLVYLVVVLVSTFVFEWGYLGIIWSTTFNYFLRFIIGYLYITKKESFAEANQVSLFTLQTI